MPSRRTSTALAAAAAHVEPDATRRAPPSSSTDLTLEARRRRLAARALLAPARVPAKVSAGDDELPFTD